MALHTHNLLNQNQNCAHYARPVSHYNFDFIKIARSTKYGHGQGAIQQKSMSRF